MLTDNEEDRRVNQALSTVLDEQLALFAQA